MGFIKPTYFYLQEEMGIRNRKTNAKNQTVTSYNCTFLWDSRFSICLFNRKGTELNSSIFLTLIVAITVGQATYNIVKEQSLSLFKIILPYFCLFVYGNLRLNI
jgi:hypothetical protein